jgi:hypothetical protein
MTNRMGLGALVLLAAGCGEELVVPRLQALDADGHMELTPQWIQ